MDDYITEFYVDISTDFIRKDHVMIEKTTAVFVAGIHHQQSTIIAAMVFVVVIGIRRVGEITYSKQPLQMTWQAM